MPDDFDSLLHGNSAIQRSAKRVAFETGFNYTEGVGKFQRRVELWQPWVNIMCVAGNPERVCFCGRTPSGFEGPGKLFCARVSKQTLG
jgi:hypothetical protein